MTAQEQFETDVIPTAAGDLAPTFLGHSSLILGFAGQTIYVDPFSQVADYTRLPKADVIFVTHEHRDHLDVQALDSVRAARTEVILTEACPRQVPGGTVMRNGETRTVAGLPVEAVPPYNVVHKSETGQPFHPQGVGNGCVLTFGDKRLECGAAWSEDLSPGQSYATVKVLNPFVMNAARPE